MLYFLSLNHLFIVLLYSFFHWWKSVLNIWLKFQLTQIHKMKFLLQRIHFERECFFNGWNETLPFIWFVHGVVSLDYQTFNLRSNTEREEVKSTFSIHFGTVAVFVDKLSRHHLFKRLSNDSNKKVHQDDKDQDLIK